MLFSFFHLNGYIVPARRCDISGTLAVSLVVLCNKQRWSRGHKARGQGQGHKKNPRPRPRTQKKSEAKAKDSLSEDRHSRGQGQECSRPGPRTQAQVLSKKKKKKKVFTKIFQAISTKKRFLKNFSSAPQNFNN